MVRGAIVPAADGGAALVTITDQLQLRVVAGGIIYTGSQEQLRLILAEWLAVIPSCHEDHYNGRPRA